MKLTEIQRNEILRLRRTTHLNTHLNLAAIGKRVGTSRTSVQRVCGAAGLGDLGLRNKTKTKPHCKPKTTSPILSPYIAALRFRIRLYKQSAKRRNLPFELTEHTCAELFSGKCHYCGTDPEPRPAYTRQRDSKPVAQNGIDRKDCKIGYVQSNCVSACSRCNYAKGTMGEHEFIEWIKKAAAFQVQQGV